MLALHTLEPWPHSHDKVTSLGTKSWLPMSKHQPSHMDASACGSVGKTHLPLTHSSLCLCPHRARVDAHLALRLWLPALTDMPLSDCGFLL